MRVIGEQDEASLETLQSALFTYQDAEFPARGKTRSVLIPSTGKKLEFTFWLQPGHAPVVYLVPGFGAHRLAGNELGLAKLERYVSIDSPINLRYGVTNLDQFHQAPLVWPTEERNANIQNMLLKVV